jgi:predicted deacylase
LQHIDVLHTDTKPPVPAPRCAPTPLAGSETLRSEGPGVLVFAAQPGERLKPGDLVAEVIDPINNTTQRVVAGVAGVLYARIRDRYVTAGCEIGKIAGATPFRSGNLLGA